MRFGLVKPASIQEKRLPITPSGIAQIKKLGGKIILQQGYGAELGIADESFLADEIFSTAAEVLAAADIIPVVDGISKTYLEQLGENKYLVGGLQALRHPELVEIYRQKKITAFALELLPRITRAQNMDILSSQATVAGYKAALLAANFSPRFFPMLTTAAGTIRPARVIVIGAGVAGLQAIATCKRLGAIVEAYDVRPASKEQIESLGAKFIGPKMAAEASGGYARELSPEEQAAQTELLTKYLEKAEIVITTAAIPGKPAPKIISRAILDRMLPHAIIIDLAAETGGNCELTKLDEHIQYRGILIYGPSNVASMIPIDASEMFNKNLLNFLNLIIKDGQTKIDLADPIINDSLVTYQGEIVSPRYKQSMGIV